MVRPFNPRLPGDNDKKTRELTGGEDIDIVFEHPGVLTLSPEEGLGVKNTELREKHLDKINLFRGI